MDRPCGTNARLLVDDVAVASSNSTWNKTCLAFVNIRRDYLSAKEACPLLIVWLVLVQVSQFDVYTHVAPKYVTHTADVGLLAIATAFKSLCEKMRRIIWQEFEV
ncbi:hypothetical protein CCM_01107 [Cordyceps militaris CM01]|uniref:Uncharacterized protein n=2 Tax=Cordyceps militaris TaxID=73501 RepID=G3J370_CORMM|nr:uncharacterized protein CCM_01107 [Cordyceps militaris CM01]ATY63452.1 hypothetical protein A9K55_008370 [Cordyceps militaris]EGX96451.1 hypothetical protein CCM_01107 [Cordyceps militaris CM01]